MRYAYSPVSMDKGELYTVADLSLADEGAQMETKVYDITLEQDMDLATTKLSTLGFSIDELTDEQIAYSTDYTAGT